MANDLKSSIADSRPGRRADKLISLEIGRFVAAFLVAANHEIGSLTAIYAAAGRPATFSFNLPPIPSVLFFFTLSGFVMMTAHAADFGRISRIPGYFGRRLCRIYPIYWLSLGAGLAWYGHHYSWAYLLQTVTLSPFQTALAELNPPAWSLRFEVAFYLMFGLCLLPYVGRLILVLWAAAVAWLWYPFIWPYIPLPALSAWQMRLQWHFFGIFEIYFFAGLAAGQAFVKWEISRRAAWLLLAAGIVAALLFIRGAAWGYAYPGNNLTTFAAAAFAVSIFASASAERAGSLRFDRRLAGLGAMSYPLYLFHPAVMYIAAAMLSSHPSIIRLIGLPTVLAAMMLVTLVLTVIIAFAVDQPLQHLLRRPGAGRAMALPPG